MKTYKSPRFNYPVFGRKGVAAPSAAVGLGLVLALAAVPLAAGQITFDSPILPSPVVPGNWSRTTSVPKFDGTLGKLTSITFTMNGNIMKGELALENLDSEPKSYVAGLSAELELKRPDNSQIVFVDVNTAIVAGSLGVFDGNGGSSFPDFAGADSIIVKDLSGSASFTSFDTTASDLVLFTGPGTIVLGAKSTLGAFNGASGNFASSSTLQSTAQFRVVYDFTVGVPDGGSTAPLFAGVLGLFGMTFRRYRK